MSCHVHANVQGPTIYNLHEVLTSPLAFQCSSKCSFVMIYQVFAILIPRVVRLCSCHLMPRFVHALLMPCFCHDLANVVHESRLHGHTSCHDMKTCYHFAMRYLFERPNQGPQDRKASQSPYAGLHQLLREKHGQSREHEEHEEHSRRLAGRGRTKGDHARIFANHHEASPYTGRAGVQQEERTGVGLEGGEE